MGLINGSLQIGRSAIRANEAALQVVGNNIANASNPDYVRQRAVLEPISGGRLGPNIVPGIGIQLRTVQRLADEAINARLRDATSEQAGADAALTLLEQAEAVFNALGDDSISDRLSEFFNAFGELANDPQSSSRRTLLLQTAGGLARTLNRFRGDLLDSRTQINDEIRRLTDEASRLIGEVARLNSEITSVEFGLVNATAGSLHDQRDKALRQLSELIDITTRQTESGGVNVFLGSTPLVMTNKATTLSTETDTRSGFPDAVVRIDSNGALANIGGGRIGGLIQARDGGLLDVTNQLDQLASALINEVNKLHAEGQGLVGFSSITGVFAVDDNDAALDDAGLALTPVNGTFDLHLTDAITGARTRHTIEVDLDAVGADSTLNTLAADIDALDNVSASADPNGRLVITAANGFEVSFSDDNAHALAALGVNVFFEGSNAVDIAVRAGLTADQVAAGTSHLPGDNSNAVRLAELPSARLDALGGTTLVNFYNQIVTGLGSRIADVAADASATGTLVETLQAQRDGLSGVSLDEEAIDLMQYQRAFQGASHYIALINQLIAEMMNII